MKGIILAGGSGTRLYPVTLAVSKQLIPVYDKPMIYYPLSVLMLSGIKEILIISTPEDLPRFKHLFGDGSQWGLSFEYAEQLQPEGLPQAFTIGEDFIGDDNVSLILGDNLFYGQGLVEKIQKAAKLKTGATIFGYWVNDPERYGVINFDKNGLIRDIEEKPLRAKSNYAITGLYYFDNDVIKIAKNLKPSSRGETEITDVIKNYLKEEMLTVEKMGRGIAWLDTGTHDSLIQASSFIETVEKRQGLKVACIEEIAYRMGYIDETQVKKLAEPLLKNNYGQYLMRMLEQGYVL